MSQIDTEIVAGVGLVTLNRPEALNALSLQMILDLTAVFENWLTDPQVEVVAIRGNSKKGPFGAFCAGGDIRFFHDAAIAGDTDLEAFFTAEAGALDAAEGKFDAAAGGFTVPGASGLLSRGGQVASLRYSVGRAATDGNSASASNYSFRHLFLLVFVHALIAWLQRCRLLW